jgi:hypothetical protein
MTPLRQRMIEDLQLRGLSAKTQDAYLRAAVRANWPSTIVSRPTSSPKKNCACTFSTSRMTSTPHRVPLGLR